MSRSLPSLLPWGVGVVSLLITGWLWTHERQTEDANLRASFDFGLRQAASRIEQRMAGYEQMLRGAQGLFMASQHVERDDFSTYVDSLLAGAGFAGLQAIAYGPLLSADRLPAHIEAQRASGIADYTVKPPGRRAMYAPAVYVAPAVGANSQGLGYDPLAEPVRAAAMLQARDSGSTAITHKIRLMVEPEQSAQAGFLMVLPLYANGRPIGTVEERRANIVGWVWAGFRVTDLMSSLYGEGTPGLDLSVYDGVEMNDSTLMYRSATDKQALRPARFEAQEYIGFAGYTWTLHVRSLPEFEQRHGHDAAQIIAIAGAGLSLLAAVLTHLLVTGRARAYGVAQAMTRELRESEERHRRIVETANEGIWVIDAQGRIGYVNPKMLQMLGRRVNEVLGRPLSQFCDELQAASDGEVDASELQAIAERGELKLKRKDGSDLWTSLSVSPVVDGAGQYAGALGMVTDITEKKQAEARRSLLEVQLRESQKMEAIGTLAGGIAHDFNNILAAILGNVSLAREHVAIDHPVLRSLEQIDKAGVRGRSLVQQILAFSRMQPQMLVSQPLRPLVEESVHLLRSTLPATVQLEMKLAGIPLHVGADATQIQQVLMNLCTNAWHALQGSSGRITIGLDAATLDADAVQGLGGVPAGSYAHLWVKDNGCGMDEATRERVFEPFYTTKRVGQGTGLGLSVVHGIVTRHQGAVSVDSAPGRGSTFHLYLPLLEEPAESVVADAPVPAVPKGSGQHVLYVDDDPAMLLMVESLLERFGYRVSSFERPRDAMDAVRERPESFDLVVTDYNMPELTGMDLAHEFARIRPGLPVVISSGYISDEMRTAALRAGVRSLLQKEYTLEQLAGIVHSTLTSAR